MNNTQVEAATMGASLCADVSRADVSLAVYSCDTLAATTKGIPDSDAIRPGIPIHLTSVIAVTGIQKTWGHAYR